MIRKLDELVQTYPLTATWLVLVAVTFGAVILLT